MVRKAKELHSQLGWSTKDRITVCGLDLPNDILGKLNLGDFAFLEIMMRPPNPQESVVFNAMLGILVEHGMTPMAIATRLTYLGAPESLQSAVAAGLCGMGSTFAGTAEGAARILQQAYASADNPSDLPELAKIVVREHVERKLIIPGIGHPLHKPVDPRTTRLLTLASENGFRGNFVTLMELISIEAERVTNKRGHLPVNATGALGALASEMGISWKLCRGLAVIGRCVGLVGHIAEELRNPIAREIWERTEEESSSRFRN